MSYDRYSQELCDAAEDSATTKVSSERRRLPCIPPAFAEKHETMDSYSITVAVHKMLQLAAEHLADNDFAAYRENADDPYFPWTIAHYAFDAVEPDTHTIALTTTHFSRGNLREISRKLQNHTAAGRLYKVSSIMETIGAPQPTTVSKPGKWVKHLMLMRFFDMGGNYASFMVDCDINTNGEDWHLNSCLPAPHDAAHPVMQVWAHLFHHQLVAANEWDLIPDDIRD